jgi:ATP-dependent exoDNAse (exonuclease V) beta subunit
VAEDGLTVIDYKTDNVTPDRLADRANFYADQILRYRQAMTRITGLAVTAVHLVFLTPREIVSV